MTHYDVFSLETQTSKEADPEMEHSFSQDFLVPLSGENVSFVCLLWSNRQIIKYHPCSEGINPMLFVPSNTLALIWPQCKLFGEESFSGRENMCFWMIHLRKWWLIVNPQRFQDEKFISIHLNDCEVFADDLCCANTMIHLKLIKRLFFVAVIMLSWSHYLMVAWYIKPSTTEEEERRLCQKYGWLQFRKPIHTICSCLFVSL